MRLRTERPPARPRGGRSALLAAVLFVGLAGATPGRPAPRAGAPDPEVFKAIEAALADADEGAVLAFAGRQVSLSILRRGTLYSKNQAVYVLRDFFAEYPPARFRFREYSTAEDRSFAFGTYTVRGSGETFDVTVNLRLRNGRWELGELRVEDS